MLVSEIMTRNVTCVRPDNTLHEAAAKMRDLDAGPMPVCDNDRLVGMLTDRDITVRATADGKNPDTTWVRDVMTEQVVWCFEDQDVAEVARMMKDKQVRRILVLNRDKRLVGIVSLGDLAVETQDEHLAGDTLEAVSEPAATR